MKKITFIQLTHEQVEKTEFTPLGAQTDYIITDDASDFKDAMDNLDNVRFVDEIEKDIYKIENEDGEITFYHVLDEQKMEV